MTRHTEMGFPPQPPESPEGAGLYTRRKFLTTTAAGAALIGIPPRLIASGLPLSSNAKQASAATPKRGGTLNIGLTGGGSTDTLNPLNPLLAPDFARIGQLFEPLIAFTPEAGLQLLLAEEVTPNKDATAWTIRVRKGVTFHNGKELTADDVIYTLQQIRNPKNVYGGANYITPVNVAAIKRLDKYTISVPCSTPFSTFDEILPCYYFSIIPVGFNAKNPVGTGPFKYESFTPGVASQFNRNENYWMAGLPYLDRVVIDDYSDEVSQLNALQSGAAQAIGQISSASLETARSTGQVVISDGGGWTPFTMRVDRAPFNDNRVRQALRYAVDRKQMLDLVFDGNGTIGNDLFSIWDSAYDRSIPQRPYDPDRAKSLLKAAGHENLTITLTTADIAPGTVQAAEVLAQQYKQAGISVVLNEITPTQFYGPQYLRYAFAQDFWYYNPYVPQVAAAMLPTSPTNETHFANPTYEALYKQASATVDQTKRTSIIHDMQKIEYDSGGYIIPYFPPVIDAYAKNVRGTQKSKVGVPMNNFDLRRLWLD